VVNKPIGSLVFARDVKAAEKSAAGFQNAENFTIRGFFIMKSVKPVYKYRRAFFVEDLVYNATFVMPGI